MVKIPDFYAVVGGIFQESLSVFFSPAELYDLGWKIFPYVLFEPFPPFQSSGVSALASLFIPFVSPLGPL